MASNQIFLHITGGRTVWVPAHKPAPHETKPVQMLNSVSAMELSRSFFIYDYPVQLVEDPRQAAVSPNCKTAQDVLVAVNEFRRACQADHDYLFQRCYDNRKGGGTAGGGANMHPPNSNLPPNPTAPSVVGLNTDANLGRGGNVGMSANEVLAQLLQQQQQQQQAGIMGAAGTPMMPASLLHDNNHPNNPNNNNNNNSGGGILGTVPGAMSPNVALNFTNSAAAAARARYAGMAAPHAGFLSPYGNKPTGLAEDPKTMLMMMGAAAGAPTNNPLNNNSNLGMAGAGGGAYAGMSGIPGGPNAFYYANPMLSPMMMMSHGAAMYGMRANGPGMPPTRPTSANHAGGNGGHLSSSAAAANQNRTGPYNGETRREPEPIDIHVTIPDEILKSYLNPSQLLVCATMPGPRMTVWLREHPIPENRKDSKHVFCKGGIVLMLKAQGSEVKASKPVELFAKQICTHFLIHGYCSRTNCLHEHHSEEQLRRLIAARHVELKALTRKERHELIEKILEKEQEGLRLAEEEREARQRQASAGTRPEMNPSSTSSGNVKNNTHTNNVSEAKSKPQLGASTGRNTEAPPPLDTLSEDSSRRAESTAGESDKLKSNTPYSSNVNHTNNATGLSTAKSTSGTTTLTTAGLHNLGVTDTDDNENSSSSSASSSSLSSSSSSSCAVSSRASSSSSGRGKGNKKDKKQPARRSSAGLTSHGLKPVEKELEVVLGGNKSKEEVREGSKKKKSEAAHQQKEEQKQKQEVVVKPVRASTPVPQPPLESNEEDVTAGATTNENEKNQEKKLPLQDAAKEEEEEEIKTLLEEGHTAELEKEGEEVGEEEESASDADDTPTPTKAGGVGTKKASKPANKKVVTAKKTKAEPKKRERPTPVVKKAPAKRAKK